VEEEKQSRGVSCGVVGWAAMFSVARPAFGVFGRDLDVSARGPGWGGVDQRSDATVRALG
jgi:hypothetical protein